MACTCTIETFPSVTDDQSLQSVCADTPEAPEPIEHPLEVKFGTIIVGKVARKTLRIKNELPSQVSYVIKRDPKTNPIYHVFDFDRYEHNVPAQKSLECKITFAPVLPHEKYLDYFFIQDSYNNVYKVCVTGESIGPAIITSVRIIYFYKTDKKLKNKQVFELRNTSEVPAMYHFDVNPMEESYFKVDKLHGTLDPMKSIYVNVTFEPKEPRIYTTDLVCLVLYHEPVVLKLVGVYTLNPAAMLNKNNLQLYPIPMEDKTGFGAYLMDAVKIRRTEPPASLSDTYLDFGRFVPDEHCNRYCNCLTMVTSLTNHKDTDIEVIWERDEDNVFQVKPERAIVPSNESILYECQFYPNYKEQLFGKILKANIIWSKSPRAPESIKDVVPLQLSLRVIGHSFPENKSWIPQVEIMPPMIILPACAPSYPSCTTFLIKSKGHLPILFKFLSPRDSNFVMKPMVGIVRDYQIVVVKLQPHSARNSPYIEHWSVELNGQRERIHSLFIKCNAEWPFILIGNDNTIEFESAQPGCQAVCVAPLFNPLGYPIEFRFVLNDFPDLRVEPTKGELDPNEKINSEWYLLLRPKNPPVFDVICELHAKTSFGTVGFPIEVHVKVTSSCNYSELCSTPSTHDFGELKWGAQEQITFLLCNFGTSPIHYKLACEENPENGSSRISADPLMGTVVPKGRTVVTIYLHARDNGEYTVRVFYLLRLHQFTDQIASDTQHLVFTFKYSCIFPTVQITEITHHDFGPLFSKLNFWNFLRIDSINEMLRNLRYQETKSIQVVVPEVELQNKQFNLGFSLSNTTQYPTEFVLKRMKICDCQLKEQTKGFTVREKVYDCTHRQMLSMKLLGKDDEILEGYSSVKVLMEVKYLLPGLTEMLYVIKLSNERELQLHVFIKSIAAGDELVSLYTPSNLLPLTDIFIGEKDPRFQAFWVYNNTGNNIEYVLDMRPCEEINKRYGLMVLSCFNYSGYVRAYSAVPIIFRFAPNTPELHKVTVPIYIGRNRYELVLEGSGRLEYNSGTHLVVETMPQIPPCHDGYVVELSVNYITVELPIHSVTHHMIYMENKTEDCVYDYTWPTVEIPGVVKIETDKKGGMLQPRQIEPLRIRVQSFEAPCRLPVNLAVELVDHTQLKKSMRSLGKFLKREQDVHDHFEIKEDGTEIHPVNKLQVVAVPEPFHQSMTVKVNIFSTDDRDLCLPVSKQVKLPPHPEIRLYTYHMCLLCAKHAKDQATAEENLQRMKQLYKNLREDKKQLHLLRTTIECGIADVIFSELYVTLTKTFNKDSEIYYIQIRNGRATKETLQETEQTPEHVPPCERVCKMIKQPKLTIIASIFESLIVDSVEQIFKSRVKRKYTPRHFKCKDVTTKHVCRRGVCYVDDFDD